MKIFVKYSETYITPYSIGWEPRWEETHVPKVVGSNPSAVYLTDITFFTYLL